MTNSWRAEEFWQTGAAWFEQEQANFLALQDEYGLNVNMALLALYARHLGYQLTEKDVEALNEALCGTEKILAPLRQLRNKTKAMDVSAYEDMKAAELALERRQQSALLVVLKHLEIKQGDGHSNLAVYCQSQGVDAPDIIQSLNRLVSN